MPMSYSQWGYFPPSPSPPPPPSPSPPPPAPPSLPSPPSPPPAPPLYPCADDSSWTDELGDGCSWYAANDPGCTYYSTHYGQLTACPEAPDDWSRWRAKVTARPPQHEGSGQSLAWHEAAGFGVGSRGPMERMATVAVV